MICRTEGIVLRATPFDEHQLIASVYTLDYGLKNFIVPGAYSKSGKIGKHIYFQPLAVLDLIFYEKAGRDLQKITEVHYKHIYEQWHTHPVKSSYGFVLAELFAKSLIPEQPNEDQYLYLKSFLLLFDQTPHSLYQLFVYFLYHLTAYLGFAPHNQVTNPNAPIFLDMPNGILRQVSASPYPYHHYFYLFHEAEDYVQASQITVSKPDRLPLLKSLLAYYAHHLTEMKELRSLAIFEEIFRD
jgi:DNA repair protein RecO (recombination protein O)